MRVQFLRNSPHRARRRTREPRTERTAPSCPYGSWDHLSARKNSCLSVATNRTRSPPMHLVANGISHRSQPLIARWLGLSPWLRDGWVSVLGCEIAWGVKDFVYLTITLWREQPRGTAEGERFLLLQEKTYQSINTHRKQKGEKLSGSLSPLAFSLHHHDNNRLPKPKAKT